MIELLAFAAFIAVSAVAAERGRAVAGMVREERERGRAVERQQKLRAVRARMTQIESSTGAGRPLLPQFADEYDRLVLEERILEADELP